MKLIQSLMYKLFLIVIITIKFLNISYAQYGKINTVSGQIKDKVTKEVLPGVTIVVKEINKGCVSDTMGNFEIRLEKGRYTFVVSYLSYTSTEVTHDVIADLTLNFDLELDVTLLKEVVISYDAEKPSERVNRSEVSVERISMKEAKLLPAILGEVDIIKVFQLKPGVKSGPEGTAGFYVRGGSNDQNLILVDHAPVYNPSHLSGVFSVFSAEAVNDVTLYKAGFPAQYGGRLSSVLDVKIAEANTDSISIQGGIGLISSRLSLNLPIVKNKLSVMLTGRRTYVDAITEGLNRINRNREGYNPIPRYYFYDFNGNIQYQINDKNKLSLSSYYGNDFVDFSLENFSTRFNWGNRSTTLKLKTKFNNRLSSENAVYHSAYSYGINTVLFGSNLSLGSSIRDLGIVSNWNYFPVSNRFKLNWGVNIINHDFSIGDFGINTGLTNLEQTNMKYAQELGIYGTIDFELTKKLKIQAGLRNSGFLTDGIYYNGVEPRIMLNQKISDKSSIKVSYARMYQYLHLVTTSSASLPTDIWHPSTSKVAPQFSDQLAIGSHYSLFNDKYFLSIEAYYKWIGNAIEFKDGAQIFGNPNVENEFVFGRGWAYGFETYVEKKIGKTRGWIGYTLSWSFREFKEINNGIPFFPRFDRRHDVSIVIMHELNKRWSLSGSWVYGTGNFASIASGRMAFQNILPSQIDAIPDYSGRNDFQMPANHRLDLGAVFKLKSKRGEADLTFSLYNAYSRRNPFFVRYEEIENDQEQTVGFRPRLVSLIPILPSVTYNFKF
ncbi:MAG: TonB-dependent receptor [Flavobacteriales bacterium]